MNNTYTLLFFCALTFSAQVLAATPSSYPIPPNTENQLFYLQRSTSIHTIIYDANVLQNGKLNPNKPVDAYWLRYRRGEAKRRELSIIEKKFAYGLTFKKEKNDIYNIKLKAYSGRKIKVAIDEAGKPIAKTTIANQAAQLKSIYIDVKNSGFWVSVNYIELFGISLIDGKKLEERFDPNK